MSVDNQDVESVSEAEKLFAAASESGKNFVLARIMRDDALIFLALPSNEVTVD